MSIRRKAKADLTVTVGVRVPKEIKAQLKSESKKLNITISKHALSIFQAHCNRQTEQKEAQS